MKKEMKCNKLKTTSTYLRGMTRCSQYSLPLTSSSSTVVFESEDSFTWDSSPFLAIIDLPGRLEEVVCFKLGWDRKREGTTINRGTQGQARHVG